MRAITLIWIVFLTACTPRAVREAESVVAQADSLRAEGRVYGIDEGDSTTLAQAYETLKKYSEVSRQFSEICPFIPCTSSLCTYAHACYHYGRLLREKDNPVEAMQVFINATHSCTRDYHILGRVYSNMGSICHLAGDYPLSYEMYEKSAQVFLQGEDTLSYYYLLNDMAFELAEQGRQEETFALLSKIEDNCDDNDVLLKTWETKAELFVRTSQYDSVIYVVNYLQREGFSHSTQHVQKAQAFWGLCMKDSSLYYARYVMNLPNASEQDKYNMLYILANGDSTLTNDNILDISAQRSDIETDVLIPLHNQWAMSVQLLEQDLHRKPDLRWLYAILATLVLVGASIYAYIYRKRRQHQLLSQQVDDLTIAKNEAKLQHEQIIQEHTEFTHNLRNQIEQNCSILIQSDDFPNNLCWKDYVTMCKITNDNFNMLSTKLQNIYRLSEKEIRLCVLVLMGVTNGKQLANLLYYSESGIRNFKNRTAQKIGTNSIELRDSLIKIAISEYSKCIR